MRQIMVMLVNFGNRNGIIWMIVTLFGRENNTIIESKHYYTKERIWKEYEQWNVWKNGGS